LGTRALGALVRFFVTQLLIFGAPRFWHAARRRLTGAIPRISVEG
jgi:hypothetical protein